ncbi:Uncharacterized protein HZ326_21423 [Fusarium oxysporum f. sp. albedinis]|nr:Uncharacterized protein HZ326_28228 [Fusarium oxysporum f. sp. albedinis]KAJ0135560.1 Uncharacterized protein HZ326_21423 [Fusarium oxysporum f. sp. albedinis]
MCIRTRICWRLACLKEPASHSRQSLHLSCNFVGRRATCDGAPAETQKTLGRAEARLVDADQAQTMSIGEAGMNRRVSQLSCDHLGGSLERSRSRVECGLIKPNV